MSTEKNVAQARLAVQKITGKKFCMSCNNYVPVEGGELQSKKRGKKTFKVWRCARCLQNRIKHPSP